MEFSVEEAVRGVGCGGGADREVGEEGHEVEEVVRKSTETKAHKWEIHETRDKHDKKQHP